MGAITNCACGRSEAQVYLDGYFYSLSIIRYDYLKEHTFVLKLTELSSSSWDEFRGEYLRSDDERYEFVHEKFWHSVPSEVFNDNYKNLAHCLILLARGENHAKISVMKALEGIEEPMDDSEVKITNEKIRNIIKPYIFLVSLYANVTLNDHNKKYKPRDYSDISIYYQLEVRDKYFMEVMKDFKSINSAEKYFEKIEDHSKVRVTLEKLYSNIYRYYLRVR